MLISEFPGPKKGHVLLALYVNVTNAADVRKRLLAGELNIALINSSFVIDPFQVLVAANKAIYSQTYGKMTTKNVHSEVVYNLSPAHGITESLNKFGMKESDNRILVCVVNPDSEVVCTLA
mmetsp:Transcript_38704/g.62689  ORF Transcript_38704/g.62689 Transcript_38704/m.62689 type:complete len:121 (+) Transcript_38704:99-461(+)